MAVFDHDSFRSHEQVVFCSDADTGLKAIIAIHDRTLGPALGGCRFWDYQDDRAAIADVLRLSRGMTYKASISHLPLGGGKAVIMGDPEKLKTPELLKAFGRFVASLGGRYITAEDVNMSVADIGIVAEETEHVTGLEHGGGDPSPLTALGVFRGIQESVRRVLQKDSLKGVQVSIQGVGKVGYHLCELLDQEGATLFVSDIRDDNLEKVRSRFSAEIVPPEKAHAIPCDVFSPCALGAVLDDRTIPEIQAKIIAGAANNQLARETEHGEMLKQKGILYAPDFLINAGGLINVYQEKVGYDAKKVVAKVDEISGTLKQIYDLAESDDITPHAAAYKLAKKRIVDAKEQNKKQAQKAS